MTVNRTLLTVSEALTCLPTEMTGDHVAHIVICIRSFWFLQVTNALTSNVRMVTYLAYGLLLACLASPGALLGDLIFRCPSCTAERLAACPKVTAVCNEIVREPGCGCCPVCARLEGELCGVYTPRCSTGLRCYPSTEAELPLQQLIQGLGRCAQKVDAEPTISQDHPATNGKFFGKHWVWIIWSKRDNWDILPDKITQEPWPVVQLLHIRPKAITYLSQMGFYHLVYKGNKIY